jgi:hypothetical protein
VPKVKHIERLLKVIQTQCFSPGDDIPTEMQRWDQVSQDTSFTVETRLPQHEININPNYVALDDSGPREPELLHC